MRKKCGVLLLFVLGLSCVGLAQETTATITGFVKDKTGAVVSNAEVVVRNTATGDERKITTGTEGEYTAAQLPIGKYELSVAQPGFKKVVVRDVVLNVNDRRRVDLALEVGGATEEVTVEASTLAVQTEDSTVGSVISGQTVTNMPLNGRSLYQLVALQPGVSAASGIVSGRVGVGLDNLASVNVNGARSSQNNWLIDGADNVDTGSNLATINYISIDSVAEFRILRGNYSAEFGQRGGGQINVVTKSGTNSLHGGAFYFGRNDALDAVNAFSTLDRDKDGKADPAYLRYHNFGYNIGGPVVKNKLFFFFNHEFRQVTQVRGAGVFSTRVPTDQERAGNFSASGTPIIDPLTGTPFAGNIIPQDRINPLATAYLSIIPTANVDPTLNSGNNFQSAAPAGRDYREELVRIDYNLSERHRIFGRYIHDYIPSEEPYGEVFGTNNAAVPGIAATKTTIPGHGLVVEWNWLATNNVVNNVAFNWSKGAIFSRVIGTGVRSVAAIPEYYPDIAGTGQKAGVLPGLSFGGNPSPVFFGATTSATSGAIGYTSDPPYDNTYGSYRIKDTLSWVRGKHSLKTGYVFSHEFKNENSASGINGTFSFPGKSDSNFISTGNAFADFLLGRASQYSENDIDFASKLRYQMHEAFVQDDWKVVPNLTLNLGLRWSAILPPWDADNRLTNFVPELFDPAKAYQIDSSGLRVPGTGDPLNGIIIAGQNSPWGKYVSKPQYNTFGPRFGFAWDPWGDGKTAIRGGYGIFFDRTLSGTFLQNAFVNPPFVTSAVFTATGGNGPTLDDPSAGALRNNEAIVPTLIATSPDFKIPTTQHWNFGLQQELPAQMVLDISYVGNHGTHLLREVRINQTPAGTLAPAAAFVTYKGYGNIRVRETTSGSRYDALQVGVQKRASRGLTYGAAYTWSKTVTDSPSDRSDFPQDLRNLAAERGLADFDKTHIFNVNWVYELPFFKNASKGMYNLLGGWEIGGIMRAESGTARTIFMSGNSANTFFGGSLRPDLVSDPNNGPQTRQRWFDISAFAFPGANQFGNAGRGIVRGPGLWLADLVFYKNFRVSEQVRLQFRGELFNAFNHVNFNGLNTTATFDAAGVLTNASTFGAVTSALEPRQVQLGLKLSF